ncbi:MAG: acyltransferase [Cellvibrio sp.]
MAGRILYDRVKKVLVVTSILFRYVPSFLKTFIWDAVSPFSGYVAVAIRYVIVKSEARFCGDNVYIGPRVTIKHLSHLTIGSNVSVHADSYIDALGAIEIGDNVSIAHQCSIMSFNHSWNDPSVPIKYNPVFAKKVKIADDVWVGCAVRVMPGVTISERSVVAAGAVVVSDVESNTLVGGVPARKIKRLIES